MINTKIWILLKLLTVMTLTVFLLFGRFRARCDTGRMLAAGHAPLPVGSAGSESVQRAPVSRVRHAPASARAGIALEFALAARYWLTASSRLHSPA